MKADVLINESDTLSIDLNKNQVELRNVSIGGAGSGGSKNCGAGSAGGDTYLVVGGTKYIAKGGSGGSGKHGISKSSKASNGGCSQTEGCSVGDGASGGSLGAALKGGNSGSNGSIKFKRKAYYVDIHGKMYKSLDW